MQWLQEEWKQAWKWFNVQMGVVIAAAPVIYENVAALQAYISPTIFRYAMATAGVLVIINTLRKKASSAQ